MFLPIEIQQHINEYAKSITRPDWRQGCYFFSQHHCFIYLIHSTARAYKIRRIIRNFTLTLALVFNNIYEDPEIDYLEEI